jgi:hypothetical protein
MNLLQAGIRSWAGAAALGILRRRVQEQAREIAILKKAMHIFSKESNLRGASTVWCSLRRSYTSKFSAPTFDGRRCAKPWAYPDRGYMPKINADF